MTIDGPAARGLQFVHPAKRRFPLVRLHAPRPWPNQMLKFPCPDMKVSSTGYLSCHPTVT